MVMLKKVIITLLSILALASLLYPGVRGISRIEANEITDNSVLVNGNYIDDMRKTFEENLKLRESAISLWSSLRFNLFKEGNPGVLIGDENWLFTDEEYNEALSGELTREEFFDKAEGYKKTLSSQGIDLLVMLIPSKSRVYRERINRYKMSGSLFDRYERSLQDFEALNISVVDVDSAFQSSISKEELFYRYDTHWTSAGTRIAARAAAPLAGSFLNTSFSDKREYSVTSEIMNSFKGDLLPFVPALEAKIEKNALQESYSSMEIVDDNPPVLGLFDDPVIPVLLIGTSYSFDPRWNFETALKLELQADVLNLAKEGAGPLVPMDELMESQYYLETGSKLVIWEIPERYIPLR